MAINRFAIVVLGFNKPALLDLAVKQSRATYITFGLLNKALEGGGGQKGGYIRGQISARLG